jgi:hypothetical protein
MLLTTVERLLARIETQYSVKVCAVKIDGERGYSFLHQFFLDRGIKVEPRAPYTEEQNGLIKRAGSTIIARGRAIRIGSGLPKELANKCVMSAVYLLNRTPVESLGWKTPYEVAGGHKPSMAHLSNIGAKAYYLNNKLKRGDKMESRALIGHLVGYDSTNIFRIWLPESHTVIRTQDVVFRSNTRYDSSTVYADLRVARTVKIVLDIADYEGEIEELEISELLELSALLSSHGTEMPEEDEAHDQLMEELQQQSANTDQTLPTPESTPERSIDLGGSSVSSATIGRRSRTASVEEEISLPKGYEPVQGGQAAPNRRENNAPRRTNPAITSDNIVAGKRTRGSAYAAYLSTFAVAYLSTFASAINLVKARELHEPKKVRLHRDYLPIPLKRWSDLECHPFGNRFKLAAQAEIDDILRKGCFKPEARIGGVAEGEILPLMWVFTYKFNEDGYLTKFKARLVVRGDLQQVYEDTYAATLAARIFRFLVALMAAFGLKAFQYDVLNAFLNAEVNRKIFVQTPEGYVDQFGPLLQLWRALYGLKEAPLLWYNDLCTSLRKIGLKPVPGIPCLFTNEKLIVFFYVDDIVVLVRSEDLAAHEEFERALKN